MIFLWIFLALLFLIFLILNLKAHLIFDCHENFSVYLKVLWFKFEVRELVEKFGKSDKKSAPPKQENKSSKQKGKIDLFGFAEFLVHIGRVIGLAVKEHFSKTTVDLKELNVSIGTEDAAETALITGVVTQAANGLCAVLQHFSKFRCDNKHLSISPDFTSEKSKVSFQLVLTSKFFDIIGLIFRTYIRFFEKKGR